MSITTTDRRYVKVNRKFLEKFNYTEEEIIGHNSIEVGILDREESLRVGALIKQNGRLQNDYVKCIAKDGSIVHAVSTIELMEVSGENFLVSFFLDISKIVEQQKTIEQSLRQLEAVNKELEAFSYSVSHDLRSPLRAIDSYTKILEQDFSNVLNDDGKQVLSYILSNTKKMNTLIDDLLAFARIGKKNLQKSDIDMNRLVHEILDEFKRTLKYKAEIRISNLHSVKGDPALIRQVMVNLISNAIKYSAKKEHPVIEIFSQFKQNEVIYTVKDNGEGFDMKYAYRLFGVFQRLHGNEDFEGTGVGLAIVQRIVSRHDGQVRAEGSVGLGATFSFALPDL
jgi:PAS domain S-box-containing protein